MTSLHESMIHLHLDLQRTFHRPPYRLLSPVGMWAELRKRTKRTKTPTKVVWHPNAFPDSAPSSQNNGATSDTTRRVGVKKPVTVNADDSMIQQVRGWELSSSEKVVVKSFSGASTEDMEDYLKPLLRKDLKIWYSILVQTMMEPN